MKQTGVMKRALCLALVLMFLTMNLVAAFASSKTYYVNCDKLYVRSGPGTGYSIVKTLKRNDTVSKLGHKEGWWHVKYSGGTGYVYKTYLSTSKKGGTYRTTTQVYMRAKANSSSAIVKTLSKGTKVTLKKTSGSWSYVSAGGKTGWIYSKYIKKS